LTPCDRDIYPLENIQKAIEAMAIEIKNVDLLSFKMLIFHSYVSLPEGNLMKNYDD
jgi:hypothetical protein